MRDYLKKYDVELETVGPLFVGSGRELNKKEYLLRNNDIFVMDVPLLFSFMRKRGLLNDFETFFLDEYKKDLFRFLKEKNVRTDEVSECIRYRIMQSDTSLERGTPASVLEFIKDPYGYPYIPGSSIKGMLRTILLATDIETHRGDLGLVKTQFRDALNHGGKRNTLLNRETHNLEVEAFNKLDRNTQNRGDAVNDVLSGLIVSDSEPLNVKDMVLCQRIEYHANGMEKNLNVLRECIKPGTKIHFTITIDTLICPYSKEDIMMAIKNFSESYNKSFRTRFLKITPGKPDSVYLGGGVGFASKTIVYPLFGQQVGLDMAVNIFDATNVPRQHKHYLDRQKGVSPHILKVTRYSGKLYQMGECKWKFV